jgi:glutaredoxin-related protein
MTKCKTVPQVFIGGQFYGGFDDIDAIHKKGGLLKILKDNHITYDAEAIETTL